jgi:hypothetical protein
MRQALGLFGTFSRGLAIGLAIGGLLVFALTPATGLATAKVTDH